MNPEISRKSYSLYIRKQSTIDKNKTFLDPIGCEADSLESALKWLKADFNIYKEFPNIEYCVIETIYYLPTSNTVVKGKRTA